MASEYVRISSAEKIYGQKNCLHSQLEILNLIRGFNSYKELRKKELQLKIALRAKIEALLQSLENFEKLLPHTSYKPDVARREKEVEKEDISSLEDEVAFIRRKLEKLHSGL